MRSQVEGSVCLLTVLVGAQGDDLVAILQNKKTRGRVAWCLGQIYQDAIASGARYMILCSYNHWIFMQVRPQACKSSSLGASPVVLWPVESSEQWWIPGLQGPEQEGAALGSAAQLSDWTAHRAQGHPGYGASGRSGGSPADTTTYAPATRQVAV